MSGKYAMVIGNTEYADPGLAKLAAPGKDAEDFARTLQDRNICAFDEVKVLVNQLSSTVIEAIDEFFDQRKPDDLLILYFSGHGVRDELGSLYLAFKNTIRSRLRSTAIKSEYIREVMDQSRSKRQVLILDCCNSGAFPQGAKADVGGVMGMMTAFQGYGRYVLTASDATQFAWEGDQVIGTTDNSLFTHFLMKGLEGDADSDGDGTITVDELYDYAFEEISRVMPKQTPTKSASKQEGEIVLRQITRIEDIKPVSLPDDLLEAIKDARTFVREGAVQQLEKLLSGKNLGLARSARESLEQIATEDDSLRVRQAASTVLRPIHEAEQRAEEERKAREEAERLATQKAEEERLARVRAEEERKAKEEAERLAAQKAEEERLARVRAEEERKAKEEAERLARIRAEEELRTREEAAAVLKAQEPTAQFGGGQQLARPAGEREGVTHQTVNASAEQEVVFNQVSAEPWSRVWIRAVTRANIQNYYEMASNAPKGTTRTYLWIIVGALVYWAASGLTSLLGGFARDLQSSGMVGPSATPAAVSLIGWLIVVPIAAIFSVLLFALGVGAIAWLAKMFGGKGTFNQLLYVLAAIGTPVLLISSIFVVASAIPFVGLCLVVANMIVLLYGIVLAVIATKAVNQFGWGAAIGSVLIPPGAVSLGLCCVGVLLGTALGSTIGITGTSVPTP